MACLHVPTPSPSSFTIVLMVTVRLTAKMGVEPILPIRRAVTISTMIKFDGDGVGTCKHTFSGVCFLSLLNSRVRRVTFVIAANGYHPRWFIAIER